MLSLEKDFVQGVSWTTYSSKSKKQPNTDPTNLFEFIWGCILFYIAIAFIDGAKEIFMYIG